MPAITPNKKRFDAAFQPVLKQLQRSIPNYPNRALACPFFVWKTITIGGKTPHELHGELERNGCLGSLEKYDVKALMLGEPETWPHIQNPDWKRTEPYFTTLHQPQKIPLARVSVYDLGFTEMPTWEEVTDDSRLDALGLALCPAETGVNLRLQYVGDVQPQGLGELCIAMEPITGHDEDWYASHKIFVLDTYTDSRCIKAISAFTDTRWEFFTEFVFALRA
jgi:hypothetical protein